MLDDASMVDPTAWRNGARSLVDQASEVIGAFRKVPRRAAQRRKVQAAEAERHRQHEEEAQRQRVAEAQRQAEWQRRREEEQACWDALLIQARRWEDCQLGAYLAWVRNQLQGTPEAEDRLRSNSSNGEGPR